MPTVSVDKQDLYTLLGKEYSNQEFDELCFEFGIELDEDTTEEALKLGERPQLKIEIPANRYDMLCIEGIAQSLNEFLSRSKLPEYTVAPVEHKLTIEPETAQIRPFAAAAILRGVTFTERSYDSFISLQDKLHSNLCRNRSLVAMGTHDLDTVEGPFRYRALKPEEIRFVPLNQTVEVKGENFMEFYEKDKNLGKFLHIIKDSPVYPVIVDAQDRIMSLPPIINSERSKITMETKNVFIEMTATDRTKLEVVMNQVVAMFSRYSATAFEIEPVEVVSEHNSESRVTPNVAPRHMSADVKYINSCLGLELSAEEICKLLEKMSLIAQPTGENTIDVSIPITRSDILHQCDIMEDAAIAYGYNNLPKSNKATTGSYVGAPLPINKIADILRIASSQAGWLEAMPLTLSSHDENFKFLRQEDDCTQAVKLANPKTLEYQVVRTTLLPGILKTIKENRKHSLPIKVFECGDIVLKDEKLERKAYNKRMWCGVYAGKTAGFEYIQGLLVKIMQTFRTPWLADFGANSDAPRGYWIEESNNNTFFPGRSGKIMFRNKGEVKEIGTIGVLHPEVCSNFEIPYAVSSVELDAEVFL